MTKLHILLISIIGIAVGAFQQPVHAQDESIKAVKAQEILDGFKEMERLLLAED